MLPAYYRDNWITLYHGDVRAGLEALADESVHCVVTSPPYWGLRDYGVQGQLGLESTPQEYVLTMVEVFREVNRVLRNDGVLWLNMGDCYASSGTSRHQKLDELGMRLGTGGGKKHSSMLAGRAPTPVGLKPKDLCGIPWRLAFALQDDGWYLRSDVIWHKPNPMPESVTDRPTSAHEYVFLLTKNARYFYDAEAVREPHKTANDTRNNAEFQVKRGRRVPMPDGDIQRYSTSGPSTWPASGRNLRSVWTLATEPYPDAHFATFPRALARACILAGTSAKGCCSACGAPWKRALGKEFHPQADVSLEKGVRQKIDGTSHRNGWENSQRGTVTTQTLAWYPACTCDVPTTPCTVLDPFAGSGTTLAVARDHLRRSIGIELSEEYCQLILDRVLQLALPLGGNTL